MISKEEAFIIDILVAGQMIGSGKAALVMEP